MFDILRKSIGTGVVTSRYPSKPPEVSLVARGRPEIDFANWADARAAAAACPTGAISYEDSGNNRTVTLDLGKCTFCSLCAEADPAIRMTNICELATTNRQELITIAKYRLDSERPSQNSPTGPTSQTSPTDQHQTLVELKSPLGSSTAGKPELERMGAALNQTIKKVLGRSLHIREVDAGSCNGCEVEIVGLNNPIYDIERFGIHFVASPRHADMLLVTGPVSRNMELALKKTYDATPEPRLVVAVGACGCSGGIFGVNYASRGAVDNVIPVDVYIPGCPPNPFALLHGILRAVGKLPRKRA